MSTPRSEPAPLRLVTVGRVLRAWGVDGSVLVETLTAFPDRLAGGSRVHLRGAPARIDKSRRHRSRHILKLEGIDSREAAKRLAGAALEVPEADLRPLPRNVYYHHHLLGMRVVSTRGEELGEIREIVSTSGNDVYVVVGPRGEVLVPAIQDVVKQVDVERGLMTIEVLPGLL